MAELDAAERLAIDWAADHPWNRIVVWGEDVRALAATVRERWPDADVSMWNDFVGPDVDGVAALDDRTDAELVMVRLPKSLSALEDWTAEIHRRFPDATLLAAGKLKHMTLRQNDVLRRWYTTLDVSRARQKARLLIAAAPVSGVERGEPAQIALDATAGAAAGLTVVALGGVFAGASLDIGTRVLLDTLDRTLPRSGADRSAVDLGCGSGLISAWLARRGYRVRASDRSLAAVYSTIATAEANRVGDRVDVVWEDALAGVPAASVELIVLNPPFHDRAAVTVDPAQRLFVAAARALKPGGTLVTVWNSHLRYRDHLVRSVGATEQWARTAKFTVTASVKPAEPSR